MVRGRLGTTHVHVKLRRKIIYTGSEGYATANTLSKALDYPIVAAFDSGNLSKVGQALHEKYLHKSIIIAGDDDQHQTVTK